MLKYALLLLLLWCLFISWSMAFAPVRVLAFVRNSGVWAWYLGRVFGYTHETLSSAKAIAWVRAQGIIGLVATILAMYAWFASLLGEAA